ncbi:MAG: hypothetical protein HY606_13670, partial [Planctomycetes bacterium]|nr:hypothetical protein [Planctomycetota bacterium]
MTINNVIKIAIFLLYGLFTVVAGFTAQLDTPEQTHIRIIEGSIIIENRHYLCEISSVKGLQWSKMFNKAAESDYLLSDDTSSLFQIFVKRICLYSTDFTVTEIKLSEQGNDKSVKVFLTCASKSIDAVLTITSDNSPQILFSLSIKNQSNDTIKLQPIFPVLARVAIDKNLENTHYFYPWRSGIVGSIDCEHTEEYGNCAWMQVISLFNPFSGTGLYVYPKDKTGGFKGLMLKKSSPTSETVIRQAEIVLLLEMPKRGVFDFEEGTGLAYYYPEREIQPGREYILPETVISIYRGDWKEALRDYSAWAHTWYKHVDTPQWFKNCFNYIIGQPHIFYSEKEKKYITSENLKGSEHILQWSFWDDYEERPNLNYSQFARYRPGDFNYHQKRGGLKVFK